MANTLSRIPTNFEEYLDPIKGSKPEDIIMQIEIDGAGFIEREIKPKPRQAILILEKKGRLLFQPFLNRLLEKGCSPVFVRELQQAVWTKGGRVSKKYSLLTDWINTGDEVSTIISHMSDALKCRVDKVYCYAACEDTIKKLTSGPLRDVTLVVRNRIESGDPNNFSRRLQAYYQSLLDPIDIDNAYDIYQVGATIAPSEIKELVEAACQQVLGNSLQFDNNDHTYLPENMQSMGLDVKGLGSINDEPLRRKVNYLLSKIEFDYPHVTLKTLSEKGGSKFSVDCCFPITPLHRNSLKPEKGCNICQPNQCYIKLFQSDVQMKRLWKILCPLCIENYVERSVLNKINMVIEPELSKKGNVTVQKNNPVYREI